MQREVGHDQIAYKQHWYAAIICVMITHIFITYERTAHLA